MAGGWIVCLTSSSAAEHWLGYDCVRQERRDQNENDEL